MPSAFTQNLYGIKRGYLFLQTITHGTYMVDDNGHPLNSGIDTSVFIYIEIKKGQKLNIKGVRCNNKLYSAEVFACGDQPIKVGIRNSDSQNIILQPAHGNTLWRIESGIKDLQNKIILKGNISGHFFSYSIDHKIELMPRNGL